MVRVYEIVLMQPVISVLLAICLLLVVFLPILIPGLGSYLFGDLNDCPKELLAYRKVFHFAKWMCLLLVLVSVIFYQLGGGTVRN